MSIRDNLRKAAGLFIELPPEERTPEVDIPVDITEPAPARTVEHVVRDAEGPNLEEISVPPVATEEVVSPDGLVQYSVLYNQVKLPPTPFTAEQMLDMLTSLPADLPLETKRQTVKATMNAMGKAIGATPESIVTDASRKMAALASYVDTLARQTAEFNAQSEMEIATLQAQMAEKRKAIDAAKQRLDKISTACKSEADRLDDVLEFFSLDVPPSKYAAEQVKR